MGGKLKGSLGTHDARSSRNPCNSYLGPQWVEQVGVGRCYQTRPFFLRTQIRRMWQLVQIG
jgi:hypothetical protein